MEDAILKSSAGIEGKSGAGELCKNIVHWIASFEGESQWKKNGETPASPEQKK